MNTFTLSVQERADLTLASQHLADIRRTLLSDGFVVLENVIDLEHIAILRDKMLEDLPRVLARGDAPYNFTRSNVQQDPPPFEPYLFKDVLLNEFAIQVTHSILGNGVTNAFYSGNTALPNTDQRQPTHADIGHLWPNAEHATPPYALVVNVPLVDMHERNGSTEIWPGSHLDTSVAMQDGDIKVSQAKLDERRSIAPPLQPFVRAGSILIRDIRMWHGGMPNPSDQPRPMIAMIHWVGWWHHGEGVKFPSSARGFLQHPVLHTRADFVDGPIDYLRHGAAFDLEPPEPPTQ